LWAIESFAERIVFNPEDYATAVRELFTVAWECRLIEPPSYLLALDPGLYCRELKRAGERLTDAAGGRPKTFCDSSLENLFEFFGRFRPTTCASRRACASGLPGIEATEAGQIDR
jgi:hypothetical protein